MCWVFLWYLLRVAILNTLVVDAMPELKSMEIVDIRQDRAEIYREKHTSTVEGQDTTFTRRRCLRRLMMVRGAYDSLYNMYPS